MCHVHDSITTTENAVEAQDVFVRLKSGETLPGEMFPPLDQQCGVVLMLTDIYGPNPFYRALAQRLAGEGFRVLMPDYFFRQGPLTEATRDNAMTRRSELDEIDALANLDDATEWLAQQGNHLGQQVGVLGFCLGGTLGMDLAAQRTNLAVVSYYGSPRACPAAGPPHDQ